MRANTGKPRLAAYWQASVVPRDVCELNTANKPDEAASTTAFVREDKRRVRGVERLPPANHETDAPALAEDRTDCTAEPDHAP